MTRTRAVFYGVLWLALLAVGDAVFVLRADILMNEVRAALARTFVAEIQPGKADFEWGGQVEIRGARILRPDGSGRTYASIEAIRVVPDWWALLRGRIRVSEIQIERPELHVAWSGDAFDMPSPFRADLEPGAAPDRSELPRVTLRGLSLVLERCPWLREPVQTTDLPGLAVTLEPDGSEGSLYRFSVDLRSELLGDFDARGRFGVDGFDLVMTRDGYRPSASLLAALNPGLADHLRRARLDGPMRFRAETERDEAEKLRVVAYVDLDGVTAGYEGYGLRVENLRGRVRCDGARFETEGLRATFEGGAFSAHGYVDYARDPAVKVAGELLGLRFSSALGDRIATLPDPCPTVGEQIRQWDPQGFGDIAFTLEQKRLPDGSWDDIRPVIDLEFRGDASIAFAGGVKEDGVRRGFRYRLDDVRGALRFTDLFMEFDGVTASQGPLLVEARARIGYENADDETYDVVVEARGLELDAKVAEALPEDGRKLYRSLDAEGRADVFVTVKRASNEPPGPRIAITAELAGVRLTPEAFPLPVEDVRGTIDVGDDEILIRSLSGKHRGGVIRLHKSTVGQGANDGMFSLDAEVDDIPLDGPLAEAFEASAPTVAATLRRLSPSGFARGRVSIEAAPERPTVVGGFAVLSKLGLSSVDPPFRTTDGVATLTITPHGVKIADNSQARFGGALFLVGGQVGLDGSIDLRFEAPKLEATRDLWAELAILDPHLQELAEAPALLGSAALRGSLKGVPGDIRAVLERLELKGASLAIPGSPHRLEDATGIVSIDARGVVRADDFAARLGLPPDATAPGAPQPALSFVRLVRTPPPSNAGDRARASWRLAEFVLKDAPLGPAFYGALPLSPEARDRLAGLDIEGRATLSLGAVLVDHDGSGVFTQPSVEIAGFALGGAVAAERVTFDEAALFRRANGSFEGQGRFAATDLHVFEVPLPRLRARVRIDDVALTLTGLEAEFFKQHSEEGATYGRLVDDASNVAYGLQTDVFDVALRFERVSVAEAVRAFGGDPKQIDGLMSARLQLQGSAGRPESWRGEGSLKARVKKLIEVPFFLKVFTQIDILTIFEPADRDTLIEGAFKVLDRKVESDQITVDARDVTLRGPARVTFDGAVRADLRASYPMGVMPWTWISTILSGAVAPGVVIDGPLGDPKAIVRTVDPEAPLPETRPKDG